MNDYYKTRIDLTPCTPDATDILAALLGDEGYESFEPDDTGLTAYAPEAVYDPDSPARALAALPLPVESATFATELVPGRDWNKEWEQNYFKPIVVGDRCVIHSTFHTDVPQAEYDIVIDPKMAFGTGHHSTTSLIIRQLLELPLEGRALTDMGTGTGILAILAAMRGAAPVTAIEIDGFAHINACENVRLNGQPAIDVRHGDAADLATAPKADIFVANINRNIITADLPRYTAALNPGATVLLSGFYTDDIPVVEAVAHPLGLETQGYTEDNRWACLRLVFRPE